MKTAHRYNLEPLPELKFDKKRSRVKFCPCGKDNKDGKFVPYVGHENKGYCHSCGETFLPELPKAEQWNSPQPTRYTNPKVKPQKQIDFIPDTLFVKQLNNGKHLYSKNHFIQWLGNSQRGEFAFDDKIINKLIESYFIANSNKYKGWILFPYIDINGKIRDIKAIDYNPTTGKRISTKNGDSQNRCFFIGKEILNNPEANTDRSFYGEHLLKGNNKLVRIFESEATATYSAPFYSDSVCIATGGNNGCKWTEKGKCSVLKGRTVILYPDIDAHDNWEQKAEILRGYGIKVQISTLIKNNALKFAEQKGITYSELVKLKYDLRDILQHKKLSDFLKPLATEPIKVVNLYKESYDLYIGKQNIKLNLPASKWGNPFGVKKFGREKAIQLFREYITTGNGKHLLNNLNELRGKTLGCYCKPQFCHGDILKQLAENKPEQNPAVQILVEVKPFEQTEPVYYFSKSEQPKPESWEQDITELENYFTNITLPTQPIKLNSCGKITNCSLFIENHIATVKANNGKRNFLPYLNRLYELKQILTVN